MRSAADTPMVAAAGRAWLVPLVALAAAMVPLALAPVLPLIDLYNHVARYLVLARLESDPVLAANYAANWGLLPNIGLDVIGVALAHVVPAAAMPHIIAVLIMGSLFGGVIAFASAMGQRPPWLAALLAVPLLYSWVFNWGFANFLFGLGLMFASAAAWLGLRDRGWMRLALAVPAAVLIFLCHGVAFALYGVLIAALETGHWWQGRERQPQALALALAQCAAQALVPAALFVGSRTVGAAGGISNADESIMRLWHGGTLGDRLQALLLHRIETIVRVAEGPAYLFDALWLALLLLALGWLGRARLIAIVPAAWPAVLAGILLVAFCPPALFDIGYVADRMPLFLALVLIASLSVSPRLRPGHPAVVLLVVLVAARLISLALQWQGTAADLADLDRVAARLPPGQLVSGFGAYAVPHDDMPNRCEMYPQLLAVRHGQVVPLFAAQTAQPVALIGRLRRAQAAADARFRNAGRTGDQGGMTSAMARQPALVVAALAAAGFDYVLLCQTAADRPPPAIPYPVAAQAGRFQLIDTRSRARP